VTPPAVTWPRLLATLLARENLTADDARWAMGEVMDDAHDPAQLAAFLQLPPTPSPLDSARYAQPSAAVAQGTVAVPLARSWATGQITPER
jgi:hypothetical protein